jgi:transcriptional regulator with XRE-family HTH domain
MVEVEIRRYIKQMGMSQTCLAAATGISVAKMSLALSGRRRISLDDYRVICWALGVGVDRFISPMPPGFIGHGAETGEWDDDDGIF